MQAFERCELVYMRRELYAGVDPERLSSTEVNWEDLECLGQERRQICCGHCIFGSGPQGDVNLSGTPQPLGRAMVVVQAADVDVLKMDGATALPLLISTACILGAVY